GGLAGCLTALKLAAAKPDLHIALLEQGERLGGERTWSFRESDLTGLESASSGWLKAVVGHSWEATTVRFPKLERAVPGRFHAIRSETLHARVKEVLGESLVLKARAVRVSESHVELENGDIYAARMILDARGLGEAKKPSI